MTFSIFHVLVGPLAPSTISVVADVAEALQGDALAGEAATQVSQVLGSVEGLAQREHHPQAGGLSFGTLPSSSRTGKRVRYTALQASI